MMDCEPRNVSQLSPFIPSLLLVMILIILRGKQIRIIYKHKKNMTISCHVCLKEAELPPTESETTIGRIIILIRDVPIG